jgi:hypothetical protein
MAYNYASVQALVLAALVYVLSVVSEVLLSVDN